MTTQADDWDSTEQEYGVKLHEYLDADLTPLRRVPIAPFLIEVQSRPFAYSQAGDDQAEGYARAVAACAPHFRLPTCDEWEYACAAGTRTLFRWGAAMPNSNSYDEKAWTLHKRANAFGLRMNASTYDAEICQGPKFRGGDGGSSVCGGMGNLANWLPFASSFQVSDDEVMGWWIDEVRLRRVRSVAR